MRYSLFYRIRGKTIGRQMNRLLLLFEPPDFTATYLGGIIAVLSVAMIASCIYSWKRQFSGRVKGLTTFLVSLGIVAAYYGLMVLWLRRS